MGSEIGFFFDCDGVLLDSIGAWHDLDATLAAEAGIQLTDEDRDTLNASTLEEAAKFFHEHYAVGDSSVAVEQRFTDILLDYYTNRAEEVSGALSFVRAAHEAGVTLCVLSSSPQCFLQPGLLRAGFLDYIDNVLSVEHLPWKKRQVELYPYVCDQLGVSLKDSWFFDDSWYALQTACQAGMRSVGVFSADACGTHEQLARYAELVVDSFDGLRVEDFLK